MVGTHSSTRFGLTLSDRASQATTPWEGFVIPSPTSESCR